MMKSIIYSALISLICFTSLYTMDEPFMCKVPREDSEIAESEELTEEQALKQLADRWGWKVSIEEAGRLDRLMGKFSKKYDLSELHPTIEAEVHKAFRVCNITEPVLVLQNHNSTNSACYPLVDEEWYPVKAMAVGVGDKRGSAPLSLIRFAIFHECGHMVAGDVEHHSKNNLLKNLSFVTTLVGAGTYTGIRAAKALHAYPKSVRVLGGIGAGFAGLFALGRLYHKTIDAYQTRKIERNADLFAVKKLISLNDYHAIVYEFLDFTINCDEGKFNMDNEYWLFHDHPGYLDRARIILDGFRKANVDLNNLPIDEREHSDKQEIQQKFTQQVKKHFPEYLNA
ncbi:MAG: hypothetical protein ACHQVS_05125 [Candidatus Babeliales bacterium]